MKITNEWLYLKNGKPRVFIERKRMRATGSDNTAGYHKQASEAQIQVQILDFLALAYPKALVAHIPNEGKRTIRESVKQKKLGLLKGAPDLVVWFNKGLSLMIEVKSDNGRLSKEQINVINILKENGHNVVVATGIDDVIAAIRIINSCEV